VGLCQYERRSRSRNNRGADADAASDDSQVHKARAVGSRRARATRSRHRCNMHQMQHARHECPSATLRRTLKRRSSSMYVASGCASVTSARSAFSAAVPAAAILSSCKPELLHGDGCGAAAVHRMCGSPRPTGCAGDCGFAPRPPHRPRPHRQKRRLLHVRACACACACMNAPSARVRTRWGTHTGWSAY
jgi:hypothetical protein